ncbi:MAG: tRNA (guanosine(46)-N7)-methyltransferase TrmB [Planctomycetes bacterium]|nr:tRNA (guanosine(46)-N7)-methyltransferase TrmB [Planctomycetota bacterium]
MSFGLSRGRPLDVAGGVVGVTAEELGPLPDAILTDPSAGWQDPSAWFADPTRPLDIEIGSGKGGFLLKQAALEPAANFLGIERAAEFYAYTADRVRRRGLPNVRVLRADATEFLRWRCPGGIVRVIHLYFSDPWPKKRHHKKRVVQDAFLADAHRVLEPGGELRIVTDHDDYWAWMEEHFARWTSALGWELVAEATERRSDEATKGKKDPATSRDRKEAVPSNPTSRDRKGAVPIRVSATAPTETDPPLPAGRGSYSGTSSGPFQRLPFEATGSADAGELVGTNFERKYRREGRPFHACVLRRIGRARDSP